MSVKSNVPQNPDGFTLVVRDNRIVQGRSTLTATQDKLLEYHIAAIRKDPARNLSQIIRFDDFASLLPGKDGGELKKSSYVASRLRPFFKDCLSKVVAIRNEDKKTTTFCQWWSKAIIYDDDPEIFLVGLHKEIAQYLIDESNEYTSYHLKIIFAFQSNHSQTLYRLLKQYYNTNTKKREFDIDDFRFHMDVIDKYTSTFMLQKRVVEPAIKEISELSDIRVQWEYKKKGKKFIGLTFYIFENPNYKSKAMLFKEAYKKDIIDITPTAAADVLKAEGIEESDAKMYGQALEAAKVNPTEFIAKVRKSYDKGTKAKPFKNYLFGALKGQFFKKKSYEIK